MLILKKDGGVSAYDKLLERVVFDFRNVSYPKTRWLILKVLEVSAYCNLMKWSRK
ncbi:MAG: hypothetical protein DHS20C13_00240 [Thermodesulfobacteriota bacterium]|nr:MAG: hypothetical protein DHS20C13_00240 [Thermodesulfobacteriota bacterium]